VTDPSSPALPAGAADDPYAALLDLPPGPRPPHFYQLLELELFCSLPERIRHAARKQFRRLKPFEDHADRATRELTQDILTRIATASVVLTDPVQKELYDRTLAAELDVDRDELLRERLASPVPDCFLRVTAGPDMIGERIDLVEGPPITIGSDPHCIITLASTRLGRLHCRLERRDEHWLFRQVDRQHPTLVNENRCHEFLLADGDALDLGGYRLRFEYVRDAAPPSLHRNSTATSMPEPLLRDPTPPPLSLIISKGPTVPAPIFNLLPGESALIGHCDTALWQLAGPLVSRHHCRVEPAGAHWRLRDLRSTNGTLINGQRIDHSILQDHDRITIGGFEILACLRR